MAGKVNRKWCSRQMGVPKKGTKGAIANNSNSNEKEKVTQKV